jgi:dihydropteroate synthase
MTKSETLYYRPVAMTDPARPDGALDLAGGWCWFDRAEVLARSGARGLIAAADLPENIRNRLCAPRAGFLGLPQDRPLIMGILNVTPDSFSDGGRFAEPNLALAHANAMAAAGADILDIGGESTRPGAADVTVSQEIARTAPIIASLRKDGFALPISIDTRKSEVADAALRAGAAMVNDVSAFDYDPGLVDVVRAQNVPICLMHTQGAPATMQVDPRYANVLLDIYDYLAAKVDAAVAAGISRDRIIVDPGIGFGKTVAHNLALIRGLSLFHGFGCRILLGASRKRFIGTLTGTDAADQRGPGSLAVTLVGAAQGVQLHRVHDTSETKQALRLWQAAMIGGTQ